MMLPRQGYNSTSRRKAVQPSCHKPYNAVRIGELLAKVNEVHGELSDFLGSRTESMSRRYLEGTLIALEQAMVALGKIESTFSAGKETPNTFVPRKKKKPTTK